MSNQLKTVHRLSLNKGIIGLLLLALSSCSHIQMLPYLVSDSPKFDTTEISATGQNLFNLNCARCHGTNGNGTNQLPPELQTIPAPLHWVANRKSVSTIAARIATGKGRDMPSFSKRLTDQEIWLLANYVSTLKPSA